MSVFSQVWMNILWSMDSIVNATVIYNMDVNNVTNVRFNNWYYQRKI